MLWFVIFSLFAFSEGYVFKHLTASDLTEGEIGEYWVNARAVATIDLNGPFEAICYHMTRQAGGGTFQSGSYTSMIKLVATSGQNTVEVDRLSVDKCDTAQKIKETIKEIKFSGAPDSKDLPASVTVTYRGLDMNDRKNLFEESVSYELKNGQYVTK